jgi:hypothetical protein
VAFNPFRQAELDLSIAESGWDTADFKYADGTIQNDVPARVLRNSIDVNPDTGEPMVVLVQSVTVRISSLTHVPAQDETTFIKVPSTVIEGSSELDYISTETRPNIRNAIGFMTFYPQIAEQS